MCHRVHMALDSPKHVSQNPTHIADHSVGACPAVRGVGMGAARGLDAATCALAHLVSAGALDRKFAALGCFGDFFAAHGRTVPGETGCHLPLCCRSQTKWSYSFDSNKACRYCGDSPFVSYYPASADANPVVCQVVPTLEDLERRPAGACSSVTRVANGQMVQVASSAASA